VASEPKGDICHSWQDASAPKMHGKWIRNCNWNWATIGGNLTTTLVEIWAQLTQSHGGQHGNGRNHQRVVSTAVVQLDEQTPSCLGTFRASINFGGKP